MRSVRMYVFLPLLFVFMGGHPIGQPPAQQAGGGGSCASGTTIVGTDTIGSVQDLMNPDTFVHTLRYTAVATGVPATAEIYGSHTFTSNMKIGLYSADGSTLLCTTDGTSVGESDQWTSLTFSSCGTTVSSGTDYHIGFVSDGGFFQARFNTFSTWDGFEDGGSYTTLPSSITDGSADAGDFSSTHPMSIRVKC